MPRVAIAGAGTLGRAFAAGARSIGWTVTAVASDDVRAAEDLATATGTPHVTFDELIGGRAEFVVLATTPHLHAEQVARLGNSGAALLVAAPLAPTLAECRAATGVVRRRNTPLMLAEPLVASPAVQQLLAGIARTNAPLRHLSAIAHHPRPDGTYDDDRCDPGLGGVLFHRGAASLATLVLAARIARWGNPTSVTATIGDDDLTRISLTFDDERSASLETGWSADGIPSWSVQAAGDHDVHRVEIHPRPTLEVNGAEMHLPGRRLGDRVHPADALGFAPALRMFAEDVRDGRTPLLDADLGTMLWEIVAAAHESSASETAVALPYDRCLHTAPANIVAPA